MGAGTTRRSLRHRHERARRGACGAPSSSSLATGRTPTRSALDSGRQTAPAKAARDTAEHCGWLQMQLTCKSQSPAAGIPSKVSRAGFCAASRRPKLMECFGQFHDDLPRPRKLTRWISDSLVRLLIVAGGLPLDLAGINCIRHTPRTVRGRRPSVLTKPAILWVHSAPVRTCTA